MEVPGVRVFYMSEDKGRQTWSTYFKCIVEVNSILLVCTYILCFASLNTQDAIVHRVVFKDKTVKKAKDYHLIRDAVISALDDTRSISGYRSELCTDAMINNFIGS